MHNRSEKGQENTLSRIITSNKTQFCTAKPTTTKITSGHGDSSFSLKVGQEDTKSGKCKDSSTKGMLEVRVHFLFGH